MEGKFAAFARRLFNRELDAPPPKGDIDSICGMVHGTPLDMARDGKQVIAEAFGRQYIDKRS